MHIHFTRGLLFAAAFASFVASVSLWLKGDRQQATFVGLWVPSILALGTVVPKTPEVRR